MTPRDCFGVVARSFGLLMLLVALLYVYSAVAALLMQRPSGWPASAYVATAIAAMLVAIYFLRGAPHLVRFAYPDKRPSDTAAKSV